ncbi:RagB/SusD family nutrient uptake outer membrane protein [Sphingobacterium sp. IITKGP-BTPF85]|uniref:RagB/SusD family nutrient uptake outer membrane protein n=1 Tax=Sphingobacterium sp. IITKGP-BTPF85 TaxID=1338009 RepID=UPI0003F7BAC6|nr:RagB/SusD family nutrient uptake outer membrane protein [Sphingobacterium sp. IITKGP-BTPF85]
MFFRSWAYYQLAQIYCLPYSEQNIGKPGLPLRDGTDLDVKLIRSTIGQTYLQMRNDVSESIQLLDETSINMYQPNRRAALMLLSRVNLIMADYKSALHNSDEAIKLNGELLNYNNLDLTKAYPFPDGNVEVVFYTSISYAQVMSAVRIDISPELLKEYSDNDLRKKGFFVLKNGLTNFKGSYTGPNGYFGGLATDELYLIRSECYLRSGDLDKSRADLNFLLSNRYKDFQPITDLSSDELLSRILLERRKELLLRGVAWTDLKRLNLHKNTERTVTKIVEGETYSLEPNSLRYAMPFPQVVVDLGSYAQ